MSNTVAVVHILKGIDSKTCMILFIVFILIKFFDHLPNAKQDPPVINYKIRHKTFPKLFNDTMSNCQLLLKGDPVEQAASLTRDRYKKVLTDSYYTNITNCTKFIKEREYLTEATAEELEFPLAFTIIAHKDLYQIERLLRTIYRPHNVYCLHIDLKASKEMFRGVEKVAGCFQNVYLASQRFNVQWGRFSLLEADFQCIKDVHGSGRSFKYLINLSGQDFPLKTNLEMVQILKEYKGANEIIETTDKVAEMTAKRRPKEKPSFTMRYVKGSLFMTASWGFIDFIVKSPRAKEVYEILRRHDAQGWSIPDEMFYATLNYNPGSLPAPGASLGSPTNPCKRLYLTRLKVWYPKKNKNGTLTFCQSRFVMHGLCIFGVRDLPYLISQPHLFVNKLYWDHEPDALTCLESHIRDRAVRNIETGETIDLNLDLYRKMCFLENHL